MSKATLVFLGGILLIILPFLGIPAAWERIAVIAFGIVYVLIGYGLRRAQYLAHIDQGNGQRGNNSFVETTKPLFEERTLQ